MTARAIADSARAGASPTASRGLPAGGRPALAQPCDVGLEPRMTMGQLRNAVFGVVPIANERGTRSRSAHRHATTPNLTPQAHRTAVRSRRIHSRRCASPRGVRTSPRRAVASCNSAGTSAPESARPVPESDPLRPESGRRRAEPLHCATVPQRQLRSPRVSFRSPILAARSPDVAAQSRCTVQQRRNANSGVRASCSGVRSSAGVVPVTTPQRSA